MIGWLENWWAGAPGTAFSDFAGLAGLVLTTAAILWAWWHTRCRVVLCARPGRFAVRGTTWKVCPNHHTLRHHHELHERHRERHPDRLGHGESCRPETSDQPETPAIAAQ